MGANADRKEGWWSRVLWRITGSTRQASHARRAVFTSYGNEKNDKYQHRQSGVPEAGCALQSSSPSKHAEEWGRVFPH
jgi:hypothetical protein